MSAFLAVNPDAGLRSNTEWGTCPVKGPRRLTDQGGWLCEDADSAGADQQSDDDEDEAPQDLLAHDRDDPGNHKDDGENPQDQCHDSPQNHSILVGLVLDSRAAAWVR